MLQFTFCHITTDSFMINCFEFRKKIMKDIYTKLKMWRGLQDAVGSPSPKISRRMTPSYPPPPPLTTTNTYLTVKKWTRSTYLLPPTHTWVLLLPIENLLTSLKSLLDTRRQKEKRPSEIHLEQGC